MFLSSLTSLVIASMSFAMASMSFARAVIPAGIAAMRAMNSAVPTLCYLLSDVVLLSYHNYYGMFKGERIISSVFFLFFLPIKIPHLHIHVVIHSVFTSFFVLSYPPG